MDVNNANTLSLMRHHIKLQNASIGHVFQRLFFCGFMPIYNQCFGAKHTFVQKGDHRDIHSSVIVSINWHLITVRVRYQVNIAACSYVTFLLLILPPEISLISKLACSGSPDLLQHYNC